MRSADERGQVSVMVIGFLLLLGLMTVVVVDASSAFLQHQRLDSTADGAALAATRALQASVYREGVDGDVELDAAQARAAATTYVRASGERSVRVSVQVDGDRVTVRLRRSARLPLAPPGWGGTAALDSQATARLAVGE